MTPVPGEVRLDVSGHVAVLTIDRPAKLNAFTPPMTEALAEPRDPAERRPGGARGRPDRHRAGVLRRERHRRAGRLREPRGSSGTGPTTATRSGRCASRSSPRSTGTRSAAAWNWPWAATSGWPPSRPRSPPRRSSWAGSAAAGCPRCSRTASARATPRSCCSPATPVDTATALRWGLVSEVLPAEDLPGRARAAGRHHRQPGPDRGGDREAEPAGRVRDAARPGHRLRAPAPDGLLRHRGRRRGPGRLRRAQAAVFRPDSVPGQISVPPPCRPGTCSGPGGRSGPATFRPR